MLLQIQHFSFEFDGKVFKTSEKMSNIDTADGSQI